jgi:hypothetical protein
MINQTMMNYLRMGWSKESGGNKGGSTGGTGSEEGRGDPPSSPAPPSPPSIPMKNEEAKRSHPLDPRNALALVKYHRMLKERRAKVNDKHWDKATVEDIIPKDLDKRIKNYRVDTHMIMMSDGVSVVVDVIRPPAEMVGDDAKLPVIFHQTRYYRQWRLRKMLRSIESFPMDPINISFKKAFVSSGFAVVSMDVRGTGASFGQWSSPCQIKEREDSVEVLDWIASQAWCNGDIYLYGISYDGMAALFTSSYNHPNVRACAPLYSYWDVYSDLGAPGGVLLHYFFDNWNALVNSLDSGKLIEAPHPIGTSFVAGFKGVKGVTKDLVKCALESHKTVDLSKALRQVVNRDDAPEVFNGVKIDDCSPYVRCKEIKESKLPCFLVAGWLDGSARSAINMFCHTVQGNGTRLLIGPWTHGGVQHAGLGPKQKADYSSFHKVMKSGRSKLVAELVKFYLSIASSTNSQSSSEDSSDQECAVTYFTMNAPKDMDNWRHLNCWPPPYLQDSVLYVDLNPGAGGTHTLRECPAGTEADVGFHTARAPKSPRGNSRFHTMIFVGDLLKYKMAKCDHLFVDTKPLDCHLEVTGTPYLDIWITSSDTDADVVAYLLDYDPVTRNANYVTEGVFRARHRKTYAVGDCSGHYKSSLCPDVPFYHSFDEADAEPLVAGAPTRIMFEMMPTSYCFQKGSCLRIAFSGSDEKHYHHIQQPRHVALCSGPGHRSCLHLPNKVYL